MHMLRDENRIHSVKEIVFMSHILCLNTMPCDFVAQHEHEMTPMHHIGCTVLRFKMRAVNMQ